MADELNIPTHRWYQKRNHIALAKEDFSRQFIYDSGIQKIDAWINSQPWGDVYIVNRLSPPLVLDFIEDYYRTGGSASTFDDALNFSRAGNATMVDSDGVLKWAPHNLYAPQSGIANNITISGASGDYTYTETAATDARYRQRSIILAVGVATTVKFKVKQGDRRYFISKDSSNVGVVFDLLTGTISATNGALLGTPTISPATGGYYECEYSFKPFGDILDFQASEVASIDDTYTSAGGLIAFYLRDAHVYRSDLGGMVDNPATGNSYVPTTDSARYLPRVGNHVYNGSEWVNEGLLLESEARTNLITYSQDFTDASWIAAQATKTSPTLFTAIATSNVHAVLFPFSATSGQTYTHQVKLTYENNQFVSLRLFVGVFPHVCFDLVNGTIVGTQTGATGTITDVGGGSFLCSITVTATTTGTGNAGVFLQPSATNFGTAWLAAGTEKVTATNNQLEANASTPSSYIPTNGSTVTRAAETLDVAAADMPWSEPVVIGEELVTNGTFDSDISGWATTGSTVGYEPIWTATGGGAVQIVRDGGGDGRLNQAALLTVGRVYQLTFDVVSTTSGSVGWIINGVNAAGLDTSVGAKSYVFVGAGADLQLRNSGTVTVEIDNISVREINPLAVSIQMDGAMTYADEGIASNNSAITGQVVFISWAAGNNNNYIMAGLDTAGANTGRVRFGQEESNLVRDVLSSTAAYSPGINVPFNIASRHGSTFLNGAVDGTALTEDDTPTALPDLSATDFDIGSTFMGNIGKLRVWAEDLTDEGLEESTS